MIRRATWVSAFFALLASVARCEESPPPRDVSAVEPSAPSNAAITQARLKADVFFLAGDGMQGRLVGTPENALAAEYVKSRFEWMGLKPAGDGGSYFQAFDLVRGELAGPNVLNVVGPEGTGVFTALSDFYPQAFSGTGKVRAPVVFAGFGITAPDLDYDDYRGPDVSGRVVLILEHEPGERLLEGRFDGITPTESSRPIRKAMAAQAKGAVAVLYVPDAHNHPPPDVASWARATWPAEPEHLPRVTLGRWADRLRIPALMISPAVAERLVRGTGRTLVDMAKAAETDAGLLPVPLPGVEVELAASVDRKRIPCRNVLGFLEGSDPRLRSETVVVCGHLDHEGAVNGRIYNGADDNASGVAAVIEIGQAFAEAAAAGRRPRRSILFAAWDAEERGMFGAWAYTESPTLPLATTVAVLNMDLVGRSEEVPENADRRFAGFEAQTAASNRNALNVIGTARCPELRDVATTANAGVGLELKFRYDRIGANLARRSDQWPFVHSDVPGVWIFTGFHPDYHGTADRPENVDYAKLEKVARFVHQMSWELAQAEGRPVILRGGPPR